jgi:hypothetical protein
MVTIRSAAITPLFTVAIWRSASVTMSVGGRFAACGNGAELVRDSFPFDLAAHVATFPIADIPTIPDSNNLSTLSSVLHITCSLSLARSRAET